MIDPRLSDDFSIYRGATALTPNRFETETATGMRLTDRAAWRAASEFLVQKLDLKACLITLDRDGMYLAERGGADTYIPTTPREVYDVTGAGDVVLTFFGLMSRGWTEFRVRRGDRQPGGRNRSRAHRHGDRLARGSRDGVETGAQRLRAQDRLGR